MKPPLFPITARRPAPLLLALALAAALALPAAAAEFVSPPGQDVGLQEDLLRDQVTRMARPLLGENLVRVEVHVGYVRLQKPDPSGRAERIKLPGFNNFIAGSDQQGPRVVSEYTRVRQIFVVMTESPRIRPDAVERELIAQGGFSSKDGDWLQVVTVPAPKAQPPAAGEGQGAGEGKPEQPAEAAEPIPTPRKALPPDDPLREPQSTIYLVKARQAYFKGDYHRALDQILQAISEKPDNPQAFAMLGSIYYTMNWKSLARKYWEKSLALDPENREIESLLEQLRENP